MTNHGIVTTEENFAVVHKKEIGDAPWRPTASRLPIAIGSSLRFPLVMTNAANLPAAMSRCCIRVYGQENPEVALVWRYAFGNCGAFNFGQQHDGPLPAGQKSCVLQHPSRKIDAAASGFAHHHSKWFFATRRFRSRSRSTAAAFTASAAT